jgi:hypothetical protein
MYLMKKWLIFYKMRFSEDGDAAEVAPYQGATVYLQFHSKTWTLMSQWCIMKELSFIVLQNQTYTQVLPTVDGIYICTVRCCTCVLTSDQLLQSCSI